MSHSNNEIIILPSLARTVSVNSDIQTNFEYRGIRLFLEITAASGTTPTLDIKLQELLFKNDRTTDTWLDITGASFAQQTGTGTLDLVIYPGITSTANRRVSDVLPKTWRVVTTIGGTTPSFTYSLGGCYII